MLQATTSCSWKHRHNLNPLGRCKQKLSRHFQVDTWFGAAHCNPDGVREECKILPLCILWDKAQWLGCKSRPAHTVVRSLDYIRHYRNLPGWAKTRVSGTEDILESRSTHPHDPLGSCAHEHPPPHEAPLGLHAFPQDGGSALRCPG